MKTVGIIGGSQFIGTLITLKFLSEDFRVKVQVPEKNSGKQDPLFLNLCKNQNLEIYQSGLSNFADFQKFIDECNIIVHCGYPFRLDIKSTEVPIYIPLVKGTNYLLKALQGNTSVKKVIFITSTMANHPYYSFNSQSVKNEIDEKTLHVEKAKFHADKAVNMMLDNFAIDLFETIYIPPVEVKNQLLSNSTDSTSSGLQYLFREKITTDPVFQKIMGRQVIGRLTNIDNLPDSVYQAVAETENKVEIKNGQLTAHF
jgi:nucleoside-diphosphate-sugar epimerase